MLQVYTTQNVHNHKDILQTDFDDFEIWPAFKNPWAHKKSSNRHNLWIWHQRKPPQMINTRLLQFIYAD